MIIKDEYFGTPMKMFENGSAIVEDEPNLNTEFITINKLNNLAKTAKDDEVETYRNFIFEIDNEDIEIQKERAKTLFENKIINQVVYSGGKSIHCRISLIDEPDNKEQYKFIWKILNDKYFQGKADRACSNPARLTRMPNAIRSNGIKQNRLFLSNELLNFDWRKDFDIDKQINEYLKKPDYSDSNLNGRDTIETLLKRNIPVEARKLLENSFIDGERHKEIPRAISFLKKCGFELNELEKLVWATKIKDNENYVKKLYQYFK